MQEFGRQRSAIAAGGSSTRWIQHNKKWVALALTLITAATVIPTVLLVALRPSSPSPSPSSKPASQPKDHQPGFPPSPQDEFNNSARANPYTPRLSEPFPYGDIPIRGINLGGWLVIEPFITPSLFDQFSASDKVIDEYSLCKKLGPKEALRQIRDHYETFITEEDFAKIALMGFNHVRIPMGHWAIQVVEDEPYVPHLSWEYLLRAIQWARKYGLRVMVELHTAPGSQNGWNHSGRYGQIGFLNGTHGDENANRTIKIIETMVEFFNKSEWRDVVPIFGVLNEPAIFHIETKRVQGWYQKSHDAIRNITGDNGGPYLTYHDGFIGLDSWNGFFDQKHYKRVFLETHMYLMFDDNIVSLPREEQARFPCHGWRKILKDSMKSAAPTMVGEFSVATNDCGKYLNGVGLGTRYEKTLHRESSVKQLLCPTCTCERVEDWKNWDKNYRQFLHSFMEHQINSFEASSIGWFFWTYKTENHINPHWDYLLGWEQGWAPKDANNITYKCGN
ncbi:glycoside hydrolase superfamily [Phascolomyces articulosus]|uniref:glucan 1,3-beta-glucosidase n=1 Tax=Phascolomyces articulosus TaxID=60185 RepID=A0AAD5PF81_9FUNG|nr:glycoside hydrolase superfamily [Phascolomyces articulosus]